MATSIKTTVVFLRPFEFPSFNETLPSGQYEIEIKPLVPIASLESGERTPSVTVQLHPHASDPGLSRTLTVPLAELKNAVATDKFNDSTPTDYFLKDLLADPMIRLMMEADGVVDSELRDLYSALFCGTPEEWDICNQPASRSGGTRAHGLGNAADCSTLFSGPASDVTRYGRKGADGAINLDGRRTAIEQRETEMRRRPANTASFPTSSDQPQFESLANHMLAEPARTWVEVMNKWRFLLDRYADTSEARDERIQKLIKRAVGDMERLKKREERKEQ